VQSSGRSGHSLVEVVVACVVLSAGILATQAAAFAVIRQANEARSRQVASDVAAANLERLTNEPCGAIWNGSGVVRGVRLEWASAGVLGPHARLLTQTARFALGPREAIDSLTTALPCR
jgi:Tfp pilus assembly protein PilV